MKCQETLNTKLKGVGIKVAKEQIFSAAYAAAKYVRQHDANKCHLLLTEDAKREYEGLELDHCSVDFVVVGDLGEDITFRKLNEAFLKILDGAKLIALQKNRFWLSDEGYKLDAGAFVALLEFAGNTNSILIGKPSRPFFELALNDLNINAHETMMIGDDLESDIGGANALGITTCLVKTGKFREIDLKHSKIKPNFLLPSIADLIKSKIL